MANREALRELQSRLASRLKVARTEGVSAAWLAVKVGTRNCLFPLSQSGEIFPLTPIQVVPYVRPWFLGVTNLRGSLSAVVDLASFMGERTVRSNMDVAWSDASVITFNAALDINCALLVDGLSGLRKREDFTDARPAPSGSAPYMGHQLTDLQGQPWQEINLQSLSQLPEFLSISA